MTHPVSGVEELGGAEFLITTDDLSTMARAGVFERVEGGRVELVEGRLVHMAPEHVPHIRVIARLTRLFNLACTPVDPALLIAPGGTLRLAETTAVEPDLVVATDFGRDGFFHPTDIRLLFECAATTLSRDLGLKQRLYAEAGIPEYWVADVQRRRLHVFRRPVRAVYESCDVLEAHASVSPLFALNLRLALKEFL